MAIASISRFLSSSSLPKTHIFSLTTMLAFSISSSADKYWTHLQKNGSNVERTLNSVRAKLDTTSVTEVLDKCALNQPLLGLRFFVWAGLQPSYRHSSYMYSKACQLFDINRNPRIITDVIEAYRVEGCLVGVKAFKVVLNLCRKANLADEGLWVLRKMKEMNCMPDTPAYNVVIGLFCEKSDMNVAAELMREMGSVNLYPDMITYIAMIKGFCNAGRLEDACALFKVMKGHGCSPNVVAYSILLEGFCRFGSLERALDLLREMEKEGGDCSPNVVTYTSVMQAFCAKSRTMEALHILDRMEASGCSPNRVTIRTLIEGLCREGHTEEAYKLINKVIAGGSVSDGECYSSLVLSLLRIKKLEEAEKLFRWMLASAVKPDGLASSTMIKGLCLEGRVFDGFCLHCELEELGFLSSIDLDIYSILLDGLCQESCMAEAAKLARLMVERRIALKAPYVDNIVEYLKNSGEKDLVSHLLGIEKLY
ncbi:Pentatricopeptide repeat-containing protein [Actinidia chinensis var. chinensis]|uniref:Pentatricopeptide repeat-containing protein n=1 Tax=Actinidia chinensis var. chinensis TaxID=1590841 RepID=A0A2R6Q800_ACTCC|nr:Pentatricopeptide repeat-containing protein [Actinidia chinensis var. chinensis]